MFPIPISGEVDGDGSVEPSGDGSVEPSGDGSVEPSVFIKVEEQGSAKSVKVELGLGGRGKYRGA